MNEELARADSAETGESARTGGGAQTGGLRALHYNWASEYRRRLDSLPGSPAPRQRPAGARGLGSWTTDLG